MSNPYTVLGVSAGATDAEIKAAYRKLAKQHHPDRGGDNNKFAEINAAYDSIKDVESRLHQNDDMYSQSFRNAYDFDDIFQQAFRPRSFKPQNKDIEVMFDISLEDIYKCAAKNVNITYPNGNRKVTIQVPKGTTHGSKVKYPGMGENYYPTPPGSLTVEFRIKPHSIYTVEGHDLVMKLNISVKEAMFGTEKIIQTIDGRQLKLNLKPGTQPNTRLRIPESGLTQQNLPNANLYIEIVVNIPCLCKEDLHKTLHELS
jgi:curved DNA-binding protein